MVTLSLVGCQCEQHPRSGAASGSARLGPSGSAAPSAPVARAAAVLPALVAESDVVELEVASPDGATQPHWLAVPMGATSARPVILVQQAVNADGRDLCRQLQRSTARVPFVLCQSLVVSNDGRPELVKAQLAEQHLRAALRAAKRRFGKHVASGPAVFIGISDRFDHLASVVRREPDFFRRVLTISRDARGWSSGMASVFASRGGDRALLAVREPSSLAAAEHRAVLIGRAGAKARALSFQEPFDATGIARFLERHWSWLTEGDARFQPAPGARR